MNMADRSSNTAVPEAKGALDKFKFEVAKRTWRARSVMATTMTPDFDRMVLSEVIWSKDD